MSVSRVPFYQRYKPLNGFIYKGKPYGSVAGSLERLKEVPDFEVREDDVCVVSYPRTGTHWTANIISRIIECKEEDIGIVKCPYLEMSISFMANAMKVLTETPRANQRLYGSHLTFDMMPKQLSEKGKIVCLLRNPKDAAVSFYHFYRSTQDFGPYEGTWEEFFEGYVRGEVLYGSYFDFVTSWWDRRHQENILFIRYEEMKRAPEENVKKIAEFLGKSLSQEKVNRIVEKTSFNTMKNNPNTNLSRNLQFQNTFLPDRGSEVVRKGEVGDWKNLFTVAQNEEFDKLLEEKLKGTGVVFEFQMK